MENREVYLEKFNKEFERRYAKITFDRQESNYIHNTVEWTNLVYHCIMNQDYDGLDQAMGEMRLRFVPGKLSSNELRSKKNLILSLISVIIHFAIRDRIVDNELALNTSDVCILICEDASSYEDLMDAAFASLVRISELMRVHEEQNDNYLVNRSKEYIYQHLHNEFRVKDIADELHVSPEHLSRVFSSTEGISIKKYIIDERLDRAKNLLSFSDYSVAEIARYLSFSSQSHFSTAFRNRTGMTPSQYRKNNNVLYRREL